MRIKRADCCLSQRLVICDDSVSDIDPELLNKNAKGKPTFEKFLSSCVELLSCPLNAETEQ